jgi:hypothetical protein
MNKIIPAAFILLLAWGTLSSQSLENTGRPVAEIFTDFHYSLSGPPRTTGFSMTRGQFGYNYFANENFSALIKVEIGKPEELATGSKERRYAFYREASISYKKDKLNISFGITSTRLFEYQQKFWGKRYIADTYQSINGYGYVADLGISADYKFSDIIEVDISLMNGEGYSNIQLDNDLKTSAGITITPSKELAFRAFGDVIKTSGLWQATLVGFAGYKNERITFGAEISYKSNLVLLGGHDAWGISGTGAVGLTKNIEFFTRYDFSSSVVLPGETIQWNVSKDGSFLITGFQYTFNKFVKIALDYQANFPVNRNYNSFSDLIYINSVFKF